jgi:hypothetical protein
MVHMIHPSCWHKTRTQNYHDDRKKNVVPLFREMKNESNLQSQRYFYILIPTPCINKYKKTKKQKASKTNNILDDQSTG